MPTVIANIKSGALDAMLSVLARAKEDIRPTHWSSEESSARIALRNGGQENLRAQMRKRESGFLLYAASYNLNVTSYHDRAKLCGRFQSDIEAEAFLRILPNIDLIYGFACDDEAQNDQNRIVREMPYGTEEMWVGRDFTRYLPGLYWLNIFRAPYPQAWGIGPNDFESVAVSIEQITDKVLMVKSYERSGDWRLMKSKIEVWKKGRDNVFDISIPRRELEATKDFLATSAIGRKWK